MSHCCTLLNMYKIRRCHIIFCGPGSSVGITSGYGLDGPGIESGGGGGEIFRTCPDRPTQPPVQWVPGLSRW